MIKSINYDQIILAQKSLPATNQDQSVIDDLKDTFNHHRQDCVGMAANMIGINKNIIVFEMGPLDFTMINPKIIAKNNSYLTTEGCLSLKGERETIRYQEITVKYLDINFKNQQQRFEGFTAQIIQHEIDHCDGIVI